MRYAFTGPSRLTARERDHAVTVAQGLQDAVQVTTGACRGWDIAIACAALSAAPAALHRVVIPAASHDDVGVQAWLLTAARYACHTEVIRMPDSPDPYRRRNERMIEFADVLHAAVFGTTFYRSGEWMTINIARRAGVRVVLHDLTLDR